MLRTQIEFKIKRGARGCRRARLRCVASALAAQSQRSPLDRVALERIAAAVKWHRAVAIAAIELADVVLLDSGREGLRSLDHAAVGAVVETQLFCMVGVEGAFRVGLFIGVFVGVVFVVAWGVF